MQNEHRIARVIWQTEMVETSQVHAVQNQLSRFSAQVLPAILLEVLQTFIGDHEYHQIEQMELDLGQIPAELFWQEVPRRLRQQLHTWLQRWQQQQAAPYQLSGAVRPALAGQRELASLVWYLRYASYPWWHQQTQAGALMQHCLQGQRQALREVLLDLGQHSTVRWRLVLHFYRDLKAIVGLLQAGQAAWLCEYVDDLVAWQRLYLLVQASTDEFKQKLWFVILTQLIIDRGSVFNQASFLQSNLQLLAQQLGCEYWQLLAALRQILALTEKRGHSTNRWFSTLRYLQQQNQRSELLALARHSADHCEQPAADENAFSWQQLQSHWQYLRAQGKQGGKSWHISQVLLWAAQQDQVRLAQLLRRASQIETSSQFLIANLKKNQLLQLLPVLAPGDYPFIQLHLQQQTQMARQQNWQEESAWEVVLGYLLSSSASYFNRRQFVALSLHKAASLYAVDVLWLLNWMLQSLQKLQPVGHRFELFIICRELHQQHQQRRLMRAQPGLLLSLQPAYRRAVDLTPDSAPLAPDEAGELMQAQAPNYPQSLPLSQRQWQTWGPLQQQQFLRAWLSQLSANLIRRDSSLAQHMQCYFSVAGKAQAHLIWRHQFAKISAQFADLLDQLTWFASVLQAQRGLYRYWRKHYPDISKIKARLSHFALSYRHPQTSTGAQGAVQLMSDISRAVFAVAPASIAPCPRIAVAGPYPEFFQDLRATPWFSSLRAYLQASDAGDDRASLSDLSQSQGRYRTQSAYRCLSRRYSVAAASSGNSLLKHRDLALALSDGAISASRFLPWSVFFAHHPVCRYLLNYSAAQNEAQLRRQLARAPASLAFLGLILAQRMTALHALVLSPVRLALRSNTLHRDPSWIRRHGSSLTLAQQSHHEFSLFRALRLPALMNRLKDRLQSLLQLLKNLPQASVGSAHWPALLRETSVAMVLSYRDKNPTEPEFYRRLLQVLALDYALDLAACQQVVRQSGSNDAMAFWYLVLNQKARPQYAMRLARGVVRPGLAELPPQFDLQQDYRGEYLQHPWTAAVIHHWLEQRRLPTGLRQARSWSLARFWDDAISQSYAVRQHVLQYSRIDEEKIARIASFLNPQQVQKLLVTSSGISREQAHALALWQRGLARLGLAESDKVALHYLWQHDLIRAWWRGDNQGFSAERLMLRLAQYLQSKSSRQRLQLQTGLQDLAKVLPGNWRIALQLVVCRRLTSDKPSQTLKTAPQQADIHRLSSAATFTESKQMHTQALLQPVSKQEAADLSLPLLIRNGGLVLLQGFYGALFQRLNYTDGEQFLNLESQQRAAMLLHYLSTGKSQADEAEMVLNKLMTGLTPSMNLPAAIELDELEVDLCNSLLHSAINYWSAIGSSTVDGFRGNWLIRNASLSDAGDHWRLLVEKRAYDILLGKSPFSYSVIRLPWMSKAIYVTWPT